MKIRYHDEAMYLFDLTSNESFLPQKKDENGKVSRSEAILPSDWSKSFGMNVEKHDMSTQVDFLDGYISPSDTEIKLEDNI